MKGKVQTWIDEINTLHSHPALNGLAAKLFKSTQFPTLPSSPGDFSDLLSERRTVKSVPVVLLGA